jgi:hypothetical protein
MGQYSPNYPKKEYATGYFRLTRDELLSGWGKGQMVKLNIPVMAYQA